MLKENKKKKYGDKYIYDTKGSGKVRIKPTLYFTEEELKKIDELKRHSIAGFVEDCVRSKLDTS
jgi:hypothetical protein